MITIYASLGSCLQVWEESGGCGEAQSRSNLRAACRAAPCPHPGSDFMHALKLRHAGCILALNSRLKTDCGSQFWQWQD